MRVFLKSSTSGRYYGDSGKLDAETDKAIEFASVEAATKLALSAHLADAEIALRCDYFSQEVLLPVVPEWCDVAGNHRRRLSSTDPAAASPMSAAA